MFDSVSYELSGVRIEDVACALDAGIGIGGELARPEHVLGLDGFELCFVAEAIVFVTVVAQF